MKKVFAALAGAAMLAGSMSALAVDEWGFTLGLGGASSDDFHLTDEAQGSGYLFGHVGWDVFNAATVKAELGTGCDARETDMGRCHGLALATAETMVTDYLYVMAGAGFARSTYLESVDVREGDGTDWNILASTSDHGYVLQAGTGFKFGERHQLGYRYMRVDTFGGIDTHLLQWGMSFGQ